MNWKKTLLISIIILLVGAGVTVLIFKTEPEAQRAGATKKTAMLVDVTPVERGTYRPTIVTTGSVQAAEDIMLSPRVSGLIISRSPAFVPGGFVRKGQILLQIDPADFENTLQLRKSELEQANSDLKIEMGQQEVARQDYQLLGDTLPEEERALVLRQPQLEAVKARVKAAQANVRQAELALERTAIKAPFDAQVITRNANVGSQVSSAMQLGRLVGVEEYWVVATVPLAQLRRLNFPNDGRSRGSKVRLRNRSAWPEGEYREGFLYRLIGALEDQTRLARVIVSVPDPLARSRSSRNSPKLMIGAFMQTDIQAEPIENVVRLNRDYLRKNGTVWVMEEGKLRIRDVDIVFRDAQNAYISGGLEDGDRVVTTNLSTVVDGAALRLEQTEVDTSSPAEAVSISE